MTMEINYKDNYKDRLSDLTKTLYCVVQDFEKKHNLQVSDIFITTCKITLNDGREFYGFYNCCQISYNRWTKLLVIYAEFFKVKKDGTKSKVKTGWHIEEIKSIEHLPF